MQLKCLVLHTDDTPFVHRDIALLSELFDVTSLHWHGGIRSLRSWKRLKQEAGNVDVVYAIMGGGHAAAATFLKKPLVTLLGGYELANLPDIGYGALATRKGRWITRRVVHGSTSLILVDEGLKHDLETTFAKASLSTHVIPNSVEDPGPIANQGGGPIVTVCGGSDLVRQRIKGLDRFMAFAQSWPEQHFRIIGPSGALKARLLRDAPMNLEVLGPQPFSAIQEELKHASLYLQLSRREGNPNAVIEAVLHSCPTLGTNVQGISSLLDPHLLLDPDAPFEAWRTQATAAMEQGSEGMQDLRARILARHDPVLRQSRLAAVIQDAANANV